MDEKLVECKCHNCYAMNAVKFSDVVVVVSTDNTKTGQYRCPVCNHINDVDVTWW